MKKILSIVLMAVISASTWAQRVSFVINDGISDSRLKQNIEKNVSDLLSAFSLAESLNGTPDLSSVSIMEDARSSATLLWKNMPFRCKEKRIVERVLATQDGYQVRNIPIEVSTASGKAAYQELVVDMDREGSITRINLAIQNHLYRAIMSGGTDVTDLRHRQMILDYVEQFRTAYNKKDIDFLEKVFSDDALIITGKVITRKTGDRVAVLKRDKVITYRKQTKREYLDRLKNYVFPSTSYIRVNFSEIKVSKHPTVDGYYGVTVRQGYESSHYSDDGYLFMLWDFRDESRPQIHVRTWQPYWMDESQSRRIDEKKVFGINDFVLE